VECDPDSSATRKNSIGLKLIGYDEGKGADQTIPSFLVLNIFLTIQFKKDEKRHHLPALCIEENSL
jgi:hypothetical protein